MPKASKETATEVEHSEGLDAYFTELEGGYTVGFESYTEDIDLTPYFKGLPNDQCQIPHWGYVIKGRVGCRYGDREEIAEAGEAYYFPAGHTPVLYAGTELVEFSPTEGLDHVIEVVNRNIEEAGNGS